MKVRLWRVFLGALFFLAIKVTGYGQALSVTCVQNSLPTLPMYELPYQRTCTASGGVAPYSWSIVGTLPSGISLTPSGSTASVSGTPQNIGDSYNFSVAVTDSLNQMATYAAVSGTITTCAASAFFTLGSAPILVYPNTPTGGSASWKGISIDHGYGCPWSVGSDVSWVTFQSPTSGVIFFGPIGDINLTIAPNPDPAPRHGNIWLSTSGGVLLNAQLTVNSNSCTFSVNPTSVHFGSSGGSGTFTVTPSPSDCVPYRTLSSYSLFALPDHGTYFFGLFPNAGSAVVQTAQFGASFGTASGPDSTLTVNEDAGDSSLKFNCIQWAVPRVGSRLPVDCSQAGGTPPYNWTVTSGTPPSGSSLAVGESFGFETPPGISFAGNVQNTGPYHFVVQVTDSSSPQQTASYSVDGTVLPSLPLITCPAINTTVGPGPSQVGFPYSLNCTATGGTPPYQWSISSGALPSGMSMAPNSGGGVTITGPALVAGPYSYTLRITDSDNASAERVFAGTILPEAPPPLLNMSCTGGGFLLLEVGVPTATTTCTVSGGQIPYHFALSGSPLPAGITMSQPDGATVVFSGTPTATGPLPFVLTVTDSSLPTAQLVTSSFGAFSVAPQFTLSCKPDTGPVQVGQAYSASCQASGGYAGTAKATISGTLPAGLTATLGGNSVISGTPTTPGPYSYTLTVADGLPASSGGPAQVSKTFSGNIAPSIADTLTLNCTPSIGPNLVGVSYSATCTVDGGHAPYTFSLASGVLPAGLVSTSLSNLITISGTPTGSGLYTYTIAVTDSTSPTPLTARQPFGGFIGAGSLALAGSMAHLAVANGWETATVLMNLGGSNAKAHVGYFADDGNPLPLPLAVFPAGASSTSATLDQDMAAQSLLEIDSKGSDSDPVQVGSSQMSTDGDVNGFIRFRYAPWDQEAIVPLETRKASAYTLAFDNTSGVVTGVAVVNLSEAPANIPVVIRDDSGTQIGSSSVSLPAKGHSSFVLSDQFASTVNRSGTIEFDTPAGGQISVLGMRFPPGERFTTIPVVASTETPGGSMAHLAVGQGWNTSVELINYGPATAQAHLKFFDDNGSPLALPFTVGANATTTSTVDQPMAPYSRTVIQSNALDGSPLQIGSAQLSTDGNVSGFIRFRYGPKNQEAIVPIASRNANSYVLAFDDTNGFATGVAVVNAAATQATIPVVIRDESGVQIGVGVVSLPANGHSSFVLSDRFGATANQRGTIEFGTPSGGQISVLGIRFPPSTAFSTIPVVAP
jgi:hypothetical protein